MKILFILSTILLLKTHALAQNERDIRSNSYAIGKQYYVNKEYLKAYKYLLAYKYSRFDKLNEQQNVQALMSLNTVIAYVERQLEIRIVGSKAFVGAAYEGENEKQDLRKHIRESEKEVPPRLPDDHL